MNNDWNKRANSKRSPSQKKHLVMFANSLKQNTLLVATVQRTSVYAYRIAQTSIEKPVESLRKNH